MRSPALACLGAYARRPPDIAFLLMRACACASMYGTNVDILYILAFYDRFIFFAIFNPKFDDILICNTNHDTSGFYILKKSISLEQFSGFKCITTTNSCFFTRNKITRDFEKL